MEAKPGICFAKSIQIEMGRHFFFFKILYDVKYEENKCYRLFKKTIISFSSKRIGSRNIQGLARKKSSFSYCNAFPGFGLHFEDFSCFLDK